MITHTATVILLSSYDMLGSMLNAIQMLLHLVLSISRRLICDPYDFIKEFKFGLLSIPFSLSSQKSDFSSAYKCVQDTLSLRIQRKISVYF